MPVIIKSLGQASVHILGKESSLQVFPEKAPKKQAKETEYVLLPHPSETEDDFIISWPGEYDYAGMAIKGIGHGEGEQVSYVVSIEDLRIGIITHPLVDLSGRELERLGDVDVLIIPGDDAVKVRKIVEEIDPPMCIPLNTNAKEYSEVLGACGAKEVEPVKEVKLTKSGLPKDTREVVVLK